FFCPNRSIPPRTWSLIDFITVGTSTTPNPALLHASIAYGASQWFFGFVFGDTPSKDMYRVDASASLSLFASPGFSARLIPFVLSWMWSTPSSFIILIIVGKSYLIVGSPPVICTEFPATGLSLFSVLAISLIWSNVGSYTYDPSNPFFTYKNQYQHVKSHLFLMMIMDNPDCAQ